MNVKEKYLK